MIVLHVAEKNDAAKTISSILSRGSAQRREGRSRYNKIYSFQLELFGTTCTNHMTSVAGHMMNYEFVGEYRKWRSCDPVSLFTCPIEKVVMENMAPIKATLETESRKANKLVIWTDCDREGENIGQEIISICTAVKPNLDVYRARFSEMTQQSVFRACASFVRLDFNLSEAVEARQELDFRIGCAFTRFQTLHLQRKFADVISSVVSYGACQFPTLGFVVERYKEVQQFVPEDFWRIKVTVRVDNGDTEFLWSRNRVFSQQACLILYSICLEKPTARVINVSSRPKSKWRPLALDTVQFEKLASRKLGLNAQRAMQIAESLYTKGIISYPRTETNKFPSSMNLGELVSKQGNHPDWGGFAARVTEWGVNPRQGNKFDEAHPPIHPTKCVPNLSGDDKKVYDFVTRHFLACCSRDARGTETTAEIDINGERFTAKGLVILERNYLDVYPYEGWNAKLLPQIEVGQEFQPKSIEMVDGQTTGPPLLTEADLIGLMERHGIGTDATHAEHIETIKTRNYVGLTSDKRFLPGQLGMGLVDGYDAMSFDIGLSKPDMRAQTERELTLITQGQKRREEVVNEMLLRYKEVFMKAVREVTRLDRKLAEYFGRQPPPDDPSGGGAGGGGGGGGGDGGDDGYPPAPRTVMTCRSCRTSEVVLKSTKSGSLMLGCMGYPTCTTSLFLPPCVLKVCVDDSRCSRCQPPTPHHLVFTFKPNSVPPTILSPYKACVLCDAELGEVLNTWKLTRSGNAAAPQSGNVTSQLPSAAAVPPAIQTSEDNDTFLTRSLKGTVSVVNKNQNRAVSQTSSTTTLSGNTTTTCCNCGLPAKQLKVNKDGPNFGRDFFTCSIRTCGFFQWCTSGSGPSGAVGWGDTGGGDPILSQRPTQQPTTNENIVCMCGLAARRLTVRKEGPNTGREFYGCPSRSCEFFLWAGEEHEDGATGAALSNLGFESGFSSTSRNNVPGDGRRCGCGERPVTRTVQKEGPNKGRQFWCCSKSVTAPNKCKYFEWADEGEGEAGRGFSSQRPFKRPTDGQCPPGQKPKGVRLCSVCRQPGHRKNTCPWNT